MSCGENLVGKAVSSDQWPVLDFPSTIRRHRAEVEIPTSGKGGQKRGTVSHFLWLCVFPPMLRLGRASQPRRSSPFFVLCWVLKDLSWYLVDVFEFQIRSPQRTLGPWRLATLSGRFYSRKNGAGLSVTGITEQCDQKHTTRGWLIRKLQHPGRRGTALGSIPIDVESTN